MYGQITNKKGEKLYILISVATNDIKPYVTIDTWAKCKEKLEGMTTEINTSRFFTQLIHKEVDEEKHTAEASVRCNKKKVGAMITSYI